MTHAKATSIGPIERQMIYDSHFCTNFFGLNRRRCDNPAHRQLHIWKNRAIPLQLDAVEQGTLAVRTAGDDFEPDGCGPLWLAAARLSALDNDGKLAGCSAREVAWLLEKDRARDPYPLRGMEVLRLLDETNGTGVEVWTAALDDGRRTPTRLRDLFDTTVGRDWALRRWGRELAPVAVGLEL